MRELVARYLSRSISRRGFLKGLTTAGISLASAESILDSLVPIAHAQEAHLGTLATHRPAGLVGPVIPAPAHREEALVPDDLGDDLEADPDEPLGDRRGVDAGVPDVADLEGRDEGRRATSSAFVASPLRR